MLLKRGDHDLNKIESKIKAELESLNYPTFYTKNSLLTYYIGKSITGLDLSSIPTPKINIIYIEDQSFINTMGISFKSNYNNYKSKLILDEIIHFYNVFNDLRMEYNFNSVNEYISPFGIKFDEIPGNLEINEDDIYYRFCKIISNKTESLENDKYFKNLYENMYKYLYYIFSNITDSTDVEIDYYSDYMRVTTYYNIIESGRFNNIKGQVQKILDKIVLEFIEFPFLMEMIDEITIYQPHSSSNNINFSLINDSICITNQTKLINVIDTYSSMYSYEFTGNFKDYILYSNPNISCNLIVNSGNKSNLINRLASASSKVIESVFISQYLSNYSKIFCILDLTGNGTPQLKTDLPKSKDIINLKNVELIPLKKYIYNPLISGKIGNLEFDGNINNTVVNILNDGESNIDNWQWVTNGELTENKENKIGAEFTENETTKEHQNTTLMASELEEKGWFFALQNSIPNCKHVKKENSYKNLYNDVSFENFMGKMDNISNEYESLVNFPEYDITVDSDNFNPIDLYPDLRTFPQEYIHELKKDINKDILLKLLDQINSISSDFQEKLSNSEEYLTYKDRGFQELFHIIDISEEDFYNKVEYNNITELEEDLLLLSIGNPEKSQIFKAYREVFYTSNIYNGEIITINGNEIDKNLTLYMFNENKNNKIQESIKNIQKSSNLWSELFINLKENIDKFKDENGYLKIEQLKDSIINKFLKII